MVNLPFNRPDGEYLQNLITAYVKGSITPDEASYLRQQLKVDPQLCQALQQLQYALRSFDDEPTAATNAALSPKAYRPPLSATHKFRRRSVVAGLAASLLCAAGSLWLFHTNGNYHLSIDFSPTQTAGSAASEFSPWESFKKLINYHNALVYPVKEGSEATASMAKIRQGIEKISPDNGPAVTLNYPGAEAVKGIYRQQADFEGLQTVYQVQDRRISIYQLKSKTQLLSSLPAMYPMYIENPTGTSLVVWRDREILYGAAMQATPAELAKIVDSIRFE